MELDKIRLDHSSLELISIKLVELNMRESPNLAKINQ
jgi:hypothetical protein